MTKLEELVIEEATKLKQEAKKGELRHLSYKKLSGCSRHECIYGQMTGNCESDRAYELITKCCERVYIPTNDYFSDKLAGRLNGKPKQLKDPGNRLEYYVSPIENFLFKHKKEVEDNSPKVRQLVAFLKGEIDILDFKV